MKFRAFTFVEVMVAVVLVGIALVPLLGLFQWGTRSMAKQENNIIAYNLALEALEWSKTCPFELLENDNLPVALVDFQSQDGVQLSYPEDFQKYFSNFRREMEIEDDVNGEYRIKKVTVRVLWEEHSAPRQEEVSCIVVDTRFY